MCSVPEEGDLRIRLSPDPGAARLGRVFVSGILETLGMAGRLTEDVRLVVSDLVTVAVLGGGDVELRVHLSEDSVTIEGELNGELPATVPLLGDRITVGRERWRIHLVRA